MTTGLGFSIGSVNSVSAMVTGERPLSSVRTRRTAVTFDNMGGIRIGGIPQFDMAVTDFADLARDPESVIVGGRFWSPANLVAAVVNGLRESFPPTAGAVATYPACYSDKQLSLLRQALNLSGAADVLLVPEPVAAAEWLEQERGPLESGFVLVYDLGGSSLDVSMVRIGPDWDDHPIVGKSVRSYDFGGRPLGSMIARYARVAEPGDNGSMLQMTSIVDITSMRDQHIRDSFDVVHECVESTGRCLSDITCILLVGGATRPVEVARTLAELGRPVVMSTDPGQTVAVGAAGYAARTFAPFATGGRHRTPKVAVFSSAAVASAVAVSAVTVFGGPNISPMPSLVEASPGIFPIDNFLFEPDVEALAEAGSAAVGRTVAAAGFDSGRPAFGIAPVAHTTPLGPPFGPSVAESHGGRHNEPRSRTAPSGGGTYANPAQFLNPLPFLRTPQLPPVALVVGTPVPSVGLPGSVPVPTDSTPPGTGTSPGTTIPATGGTSTADGAPGTTAGETTTGTGGSTSGGSGSGGSTGNASGGSASGTGGSTAGDSTSGGSSDSAAGGSTSTGTSGGATGGSTSGGSTSSGASGASGGGGSGGSANGGGSGASGGATGASGGGGSGSGGTPGASGGGASGDSRNGGASGGSTNSGALGGSVSGGAQVGSTSGGTSGGSASGGMPGGSTNGGTFGRSTGGGTSAGSTGGNSVSGRSSGGTTSGGSGSGGAASGGISSHGSGGLGGGGAHR